MKHVIRNGRNLIGALSLAQAVMGCSAEYADYQPESEPIDSASEALAACEGDDLQYDFNGFAASLAVAIANELGRWDVITDFEIRSGKLELSTTGELHCGSGCGNVRAILRLQDDASGVVPTHSPSIFRSKLTTWYGLQKEYLTDMVDDMLHVDKGVYRIRANLSGKYIVPQGGSTSDGARLQQSDQYNWSNASQWRIVLQGTTHQIVNVKSGRCMDLETNTNGMTNLVQRSCTGFFTQWFRFSQVNPTSYALRTGHQQALRVANSSTWNGAAIVQEPFHGDWLSEYFTFEPVGSGAHVDLREMAAAVYSLRVQQTGMAIGVASGSTADGARVEQQGYSPSDDRFHWYINRFDSINHQLINRRTGKCLDVQDPNSKASPLVQRTCSTAWSQRFQFVPTGIGSHAIYSLNGVAIGVENGSTSGGARITQTVTTWEPYNLITADPILAGEPHRLQFSHVTQDGPCGDYYWYDIAQPNGVPLDAPQDTFVQLIFAGGKESLTGRDINPFIAQQVAGNKVAIDPSGYMNSGSKSTSGSCVDADILYDASGRSAGGCCIRYDGRYGRFVQSSWSKTTYVCQ